MNKVYVLTGISGIYEDEWMSIIDIFINEKDAVDKMNIIEDEMEILRGKYSSEEKEKLDDQLFDWMHENPAFSGPYPELPTHLKEFKEHQNKTYYHTLNVKEYTLK